jgi:hypothetical protein
MRTDEMATVKERLPIKYPEDGIRMLDVITEMTLQHSDFAARVRGARIHALERYIERDETGRVVSEGFVIEAVFSVEQQEEQLRNGWGVTREEMLVSA